MSLSPTYVRARDGALYKSPVLIFPEGFVCFDDTDPPELVLWLPVLDVVEVMGRVLGRAANPGTLIATGESQRVLPLSEPWEFKPAAAWTFELTGRIPRPQKHDGTERYPSRCVGLVLDLPPHQLDASEIEIPEKL
tara:strand:- start:8677 stop:9084 length:408 start_codon:yes stop_codon:yes gene_type:complete